MTDQGLNHLSPLKNLKHLNLSKSNITDLGLFSLFREIKGVTSLKIEFCDQISNTQPEFLSSLSLDKLEISDCMQMTDDSLNEKPSHSLLVKLASIVPVHLPLGGAKSLKLTGFPQLTDVGIKHLKEALLKKLRLEMCHNITGSGLQDLNQLKQISLYDCNSMTDIALDNLKNLKNLSHVDLYKCPNISQSARDNFSDYFRSGFLNTGLFTRNKFYHS